MARVFPTAEGSSTTWWTSLSESAWEASSTWTSTTSPTTCSATASTSTTPPTAPRSPIPPRRPMAATAVTSIRERWAGARFPEETQNENTSSHRGSRFHHRIPRRAEDRFRETLAQEGLRELPREKRSRARARETGAGDRGSRVLPAGGGGPPGFLPPLP